MNRFRTRLRSRLLLVALIAVAPALIALVVTQTAARRRAQQHALDDNLRLVRLAADQQAGIFDGARSLLVTLAELPELRAADPAGCEAGLGRALRAQRGYLALTVANPDGSIFCSTAPAGTRALTNLSGRAWFQRVMRTRTTATGDYQSSTISGPPGIVVAHPLLDDGGHVTRIVVAAVALERLAAVMSRADLPPGAILTLFDQAGTILARVPGDGDWIGHTVPDPRPLRRLAGGAAEYKSESAGVDGIVRFFVTVPLRATIATNLYIGMGIDHAAAFRESDATYTSFLWLLAIVSLAGAGAAVIGSHLFVFRPVKTLTAVADRIAAGDLTARAQLARSVSGISELGDAVDAMAGALDAREAALTERAAVMMVLSELGFALNQPQGLAHCLQHCAEAILAHLDLAAVQIAVVNPAGGGSEQLASAGPGSEGELPSLWPLSEGDRPVGMLSLTAGRRLTDGEAAGVTSIAALLALGITRHQTEAARQLLASIVEGSDEAIYGTRRDGTIVSWNRGSERLFGYTREQILGRSVLLLYPPDRQGELPELLARVNGGEYVTDLDTVRQRRGGAALPISLTLAPMHDVGGQVIGASAIARDLTNRRRTEARLNLLARALESTNEMVSVTDTDDRFTFVNAAFLREYGYEADEVLGQTPALVQAPHTPIAVLQDILRESRRAGWKGELLNRRRDGSEFFVTLNTSAVRDERGAIVGLLGVARNTTERRALEEQLRQSQKMDAIGQLAGGVAHDFNNLLTVIRGFAGFLEEELPAPDPRRDSVVEIQRAAERATVLTRQLLAFSRKQILDVRVLRLGDVVGEISPMLRQLLGESIDFRTSINDRGQTRADPGQLEQVIVNLAVNARDAMPAGGRLTIATSDIALDDRFARSHPSVHPGPHVCLAVTDTGHGMDVDIQAHVFEPFFTTKPMGRGTGLGLSTVYGIVKQSGGSVWVESEVGRGTTLTVYLPVTDGQETPEVEPPPVETRVEGGIEAVLVVEDEEQIRVFASRVLASHGYRVHAVGDPIAALAYARLGGSAIDLVVSDVVLPQMSGPAMIREMRDGSRAFKVLFISGYSDAELGSDGVIDEQIMFLQKPFAADTLARKVRAALDG